MLKLDKLEQGESELFPYTTYHLRWIINQNVDKASRRTGGERIFL